MGNAFINAFTLHFKIFTYPLQDKNGKMNKVSTEVLTWKKKKYWN